MDEQVLQAELTVKKSHDLQDHHRWLLIVLVLLLLAAAIIFLGKSEGNNVPVISDSPNPTEDVSFRTYTVSYRSGVFSPTNLRIHAGDTVRFKNDAILSIRVVSDDIVGFTSVGDVPAGSFFSFTFAAKGTFSYHNERNIAEAGSIIVR